MSISLYWSLCLCVSAKQDRRTQWQNTGEISGSHLQISRQRNNNTTPHHIRQTFLAITSISLVLPNNFLALCLSDCWPNAWDVWIRFQEKRTTIQNKCKTKTRNINRITRKPSTWETTLTMPSKKVYKSCWPLQPARTTCYIKNSMIRGINKEALFKLTLLYENSFFNWIPLFLPYFIPVRWEVYITLKWKNIRISMNVMW